MTKITKHPFAKEMLEYAQDAQITDKPWEMWEVNYPDSIYGWQHIIKHPEWDNRAIYRRKPQTYMIGKIEVPLPLKVHPKKGQEYFYVDFSTLTDFVSSLTWYNDRVDITLFEAGLAYLNKEDAKKVAEAILALIPK